MTTDLLPALTAHVTAMAHAGPRTCRCTTATLAAREDATVVRHAGTVAKAHASDMVDIEARLAPFFLPLTVVVIEQPVDTAEPTA